MEITRVILRASDLEASVSFWSETVGLAVLGQGPAFAFLDGGGVQLALNQAQGDMEPDSSLTELVFEAEDVRATHAELAARGAPFEVELRAVTEDGERDLLAAHFRDPDGHVASLTGWVVKG